MLLRYSKSIRIYFYHVDAEPGKLCIAYTSKPFLPAIMHPDCLKGLEETVRLCRDLGHDVEEASPQIDGPAFVCAFFTMVCSETMAWIEASKVNLNRKPAPGILDKLG